MNINKQLITRASKIVERTLRTLCEELTIYHEGTTNDVNEHISGEIKVWRYDGHNLCILIVRDENLTLTGFPGMHQTEHFGAINSMEFYLGHNKNQDLCL